MAFTTTSIGANSVAIAYSESSEAEMRAEIISQMSILGGWNLILDEYPYSYFSRAQVGGPSDTYLKGIRLGVYATTMQMVAFEKMDQVADSSTVNVKGYSTSMSVDFAVGGTLYMICAPTHVVFFSEEDVAGTQTTILSTFEVSRDHGIPVGPQSPFQLWTPNQLIYNANDQFTSSMNNNGIQIMSGLTYHMFTTDFATWGWLNSGDTTESANQALPAADYVTGKNMVSSVRVQFQYSSTTSSDNYPRAMGRVYGLNVVSGYVSDRFETISIPVDANGFADTLSGTPKDHVVVHQSNSGYGTGNAFCVAL